MNGLLDSVRKATEARNMAARRPEDVVWEERIRAAHAAGYSYRAIAAEAGVSFQRVAQIVQAEGKGKP